MKLKFLQFFTACAMLFSAPMFLTSCTNDNPRPEPEPEPEPLGFISLSSAGKNTYTYHIEVEEDESYKHLAIPKSVFDNYTNLYEGNEAAATALLFGIYGSDGNGPKDYTVTSPTEKPSQDVVAGMEYLVMAYRTNDSGEPTMDSEKYTFRTQEPGKADGSIAIEITRMTASEADFSYGVSGDIKIIWNYIMYADDYNALLKSAGEDGVKSRLVTVGTRMDKFENEAEWANLEASTDYMLLVLGIDSNGDHTEFYKVPFTTSESGEIDTENIVFDRSLIAMCDEEEAGLYSNLFLLANCPMEEDEYGDFYPSETESGILLYCGLLTKAPVDGRIPEGTYQMTEGMDVDCWSYDNTWGVCYTEAGDILEVLFSSGTVEVSYKGNGYLMKFDFVTEEGKAFTGTFEGLIAFEM